MSASYQAPSVESVVDAGALVLARTGASPGIDNANHEADDLGTQQEDHGRHGPGGATPPASPPEIRKGASMKVEDNGHRDFPHRSQSPSAASAVTNMTSATHKSNGSHGSGSTVTRRPHPRRGNDRSRNGEGRPPADVNAEEYDVETTPKPHQTPYFESDIGEAPHRTSRRGQDRGWRLGNLPNHKGANSKSVSSAVSSLNSDVFSEMSLVPSNEGTLSSPDRSEPADSPNSRFFPNGHCPPAPAPPQQQQQQHQPQRDPFMYMVPGMPYGQPGPGQQNPPSQQQALTFYEQFPQQHRPDKLPATGYQLLASRLSLGESREAGGATLPPMYRRFESLNHRLLLHLQDELMELEEQLHQLDAVDTQSRRGHHGFHPASRRGEAAAATDFHWFKTDMLGKIGFKLNQYNQVLTSFKQTQDLPSPEFSDIDIYREYLATHNPVVESESRFLDMEEDLVSLCRPGFAHPGPDFTDDLLTPMPRKTIGFPPTPTSPLSEVGSRVSAQRLRGRPGLQHQERPSGSSDVPMIAATVAAAFLLPVLSFIVIPGLMGRLAVVLLMSVATAIALLQTGLAQQPGSATNVTMCAGVYGAAMAVVAAIV